jgi:hypothetical protein
MNIAGTHFHIADIDDVWPRIATRAQRCRCDPAFLRDLRCRCHASGDAVCLQGPEGVVIMSAAGTEDGHLRATVLLAVSCTGQPGAFRREEEAMLAVARDLGASELCFQTDRRGWARMLGPAWHEHDGAFFRETGVTLHG